MNYDPEVILRLPDMNGWHRTWDRTEMDKDLWCVIQELEKYKAENYELKSKLNEYDQN